MRCRGKPHHQNFNLVDVQHGAIVELKFSGVKCGDVAIASTEENVKAAAERAKELEEKNTILNKIGKASEIIDVIGDQVKDVSIN